MALQRNTVLILQSVLITLAYIFVLARLVLRLVNRQKRQLWSDAWLVIAAIDLALMQAGNTMIFQLRGINRTEEESKTPVHDAVPRLFYACTFLYDVGIYFPKFSIIAFYYSSFSETSRKLRMALHALTAFTVSACVATFFMDVFWCGTNVSSNWANQPGGCKRLGALSAVRVAWSLNFSSDLFIMMVPIPILLNLRLRTLREKVAIISAFALGTITMIVSLGRFITVNVKLEIANIFVWSTAEYCTALMVVALPALRPLLYKFSVKSKQIRSKSSSKKSKDAKCCCECGKHVSGEKTLVPGTGADGHEHVNEKDVRDTKKDSIGMALQSAWEDIELNDVGGLSRADTRDSF